MDEIHSTSGRDLDWFATDAEGSIAFFTTGGSAPLPRGWAASLETWASRAYALVEELPKVCDAIVSTGKLRDDKLWNSPDLLRPLRLGGWLDMAERGLYTFDTVDVNRHPSAYMSIARPRSARDISHVGGELRGLLQTHAIPWLKFREVDVIEPAQIFREESNK